MNTQLQKSEYPKYYTPYIEKVPAGKLRSLFKSIHKETQEFLATVGEINGNFRYEPGKWTLKEVLMHMIDTEKIFAYRALAFARKDESSLPGFDENKYADAVDVSKRTIKDLMEEFDLTRKMTMQTFKHFTEEELSNKGTASQNKISVRAIGYVIIGHEMHHRQVIQDKYLGKETKI